MDKYENGMAQRNDAFRTWAIGFVLLLGIWLVWSSTQVQWARCALGILFIGVIVALGRSVFRLLSDPHYGEIE